MSATVALIFLKVPPVHAFRGTKQDKFAFVRATVGEWTGGRVSNALVGVTFVVMTGLPIAFLLAT